MIRSFVRPDEYDADAQTAHLHCMQLPGGCLVAAKARVHTRLRPQFVQTLGANRVSAQIVVSTWCALEPSQRGIPQGVAYNASVQSERPHDQYRRKRLHIDSFTYSLNAYRRRNAR